MATTQGLGNNAGGSHRPHFSARAAVYPKPYLEGQGDLVSRLILGITGVSIRIIGVIDLLTKSPGPSK